jgi:hypothetical protein
MKKVILSALACSIGIVLLIGCENGGLKTTKNEYLGDIPSLEKGYYEKMEAKEKALKECTDMEKAFELAKEKDLLKEEWENKVKESFTNNPLTKPLPFEGSLGEGYSLKEIKVDNATRGNMNLKFVVQIENDMKNEYGGALKDIVVYFKAVDKEDKDIEGSTTVAVMMQRQELKAGMTVECTGTWQNKGLRNMENFAKIVIITKEAYDQVK